MPDTRPESRRAAARASQSDSRFLGSVLAIDGCLPIICSATRRPGPRKVRAGHGQMIWLWAYSLGTCLCDSPSMTVAIDKPARFANKKAHRDETNTRTQKNDLASVDSSRTLRAHPIAALELRARMWHHQGCRLDAHDAGSLPRIRRGW